MTSVLNASTAQLRPQIPRQVSSATHDVVIGEEGEAGTLTVSSAPGLGVVGVDLRVGQHGSALAR